MIVPLATQPAALDIGNKSGAWFVVSKRKRMEGGVEWRHCVQALWYHHRDKELHGTVELINCIASPEPAVFHFLSKLCLLGELCSL